jgi:hypothetical protein
MNRHQRELLRVSLESWKPRQTVEIRVDRLRSLLDECDKLDDACDSMAAELCGEYDRSEDAK